MSTIAVVAHAGKSFGGGLGELREVLAREGFADPLWYEVAKSRKAPKYARRALQQGAEVLFVWGGDGTVQRCVNAIAGTETVLAILPAGTANLLATNLGVPDDLTAAVRVGLHGDHRPLDTGSVNGEHFAVMAGAGFDARMIKEADRGMKDRFGRAAYLYAGPDQGPSRLDQGLRPRGDSGPVLRRLTRSWPARAQSACRAAGGPSPQRQEHRDAACHPSHTEEPATDHIGRPVHSEPDPRPAGRGHQEALSAEA
jgi:hypothetical protein